MKQYLYTCRLLSEVVMSSSAATQGFNPSLDYIAGAKFLGIVAGQLYDQADTQTTLDVFHNGKVRFGDAHPYVLGERSLKVPFSWYIPKGKKLTDNKIYLYHELPAVPEAIKSAEQPKQARKGFFTPKKEKVIYIDQNFSIKSAYDRKTMRSKDAQMYGYFSLKAGTTWAFVVEDETGLYGETLQKCLEGKHQIGRSRSAEYGLTEVRLEKELTPTSGLPLASTFFLYAASNLCFYDDFGRPTGQPSTKDLNLPDGATILWEQSQIRTRLYQTWNRKRFNRDADRWIIEKGSVFAIQLPASNTNSLTADIFKNGVGAHRAEGFGQVMVQPAFLQTAPIGFSKVDVEDWATVLGKANVKKGNNDEVVLAFLMEREKHLNTLFDIDKVINDFTRQYASTYAGVSNSQWGMLSNYAKHAGNNETLEKLLFLKDFGCLYRGKSEATWRKMGRREKLEKFLFPKQEKNRQIPLEYIIPFTIKLAAQMAKSRN